jgi:hypothetical protein
VQHQRRRRLWGLTILWLGTVAVALLAVTLVLREGPHPHERLSLFLVVIEVIILAILISGLLPIAREHHEWIRERVRAELLRRELFLFEASVGPYLGGRAVDRIAEQRIRHLSSHEEPLALIAMEDESSGSWRDALEDARVDGSLVPDGRCGELIERYGSERVRRQHDWFTKRSARHGWSDRRSEFWGRLLILIGLVLAIVRASAEIAPEVGEYVPVSWLMALGVILAGLGSFVLARRSMFQAHRLRRSYADYADTLMAIERELIGLIDRVDDEPDAVDFEFKRLVLRSEDLLSNELRLWWLSVEPEIPA